MYMVFIWLYLIIFINKVRYCKVINLLKDCLFVYIFFLIFMYYIKIIKIIYFMGIYGGMKRINIVEKNIVFVFWLNKFLINFFILKIFEFKRKVYSSLCIII